MTRLLIDTDAGIDDAEALMMALSHPGAQVEAITTVTGNVRVEQVNKNVCAVLTTMDAAVPVYSGAALPLVEAWQGSAQYHLADGLGAWDQRPPCEPVVEQDHAANALVRLAADNPGELTLVALGPLTNIALAVRLRSSILAPHQTLYLHGWGG